VTPPEIVEQMLRLARVGPTDIVYDLGSGDGRLVIAAVQDFRAPCRDRDRDPAPVAAPASERAGPGSGTA
jgi:predicted RNA methylase